MGELDDWFLTAEERGNPWARIDRGASARGMERRATGSRCWSTAPTYFRRLYEVLTSLRARRLGALHRLGGRPRRAARRPGHRARARPRRTWPASGRARARAAVALAPGAGQLRRAAEPRPHEERSTRPAARSSSTSGCGAAAATTRSSCVTRRQRRARRRRRVRRRHRPLPRPPRRRPPPRRSAGDRARRRATATARRGTTCRASCTAPAVAAIADTFRERWEDPHPLDHRNPWRRVVRKFTRQPRHPDPLPPRRDEPAPCGPHAVQVLRTYPAKHPAYPFAPEGERSIARAYLKALPRARRLVYLEDQYFWSERAAHALADALRAQPDLHVVVVVPRFPDRDGRVAGPAARIGRERATRIVDEAGGDRVLVCDLENEEGTPDLRARQGVHRRRRVADGRLRQHEPTLVDPRLRAVVRRARRHPRRARARAIPPAWATAHGGSPATPGCSCGASTSAAPRRPGSTTCSIPRPAFTAFRRTAQALDAWHAGGRVGDRPPGHVRIHQPERVPTRHRWWARAVSRVLNDPDGRPTRPSARRPLLNRVREARKASV